MKTFKKFKSPSSILVTAAPILNCFDIHIIIVFITLNEINSDERVQGGQKGRWKDNDPRETEQHLYERRAIKSFLEKYFSINDSIPSMPTTTSQSNTSNKML